MTSSHRLGRIFFTGLLVLVPAWTTFLILAALFDTLDSFLNINCPFLLFPFLRRLVADVTREGGFPPLLLDPIDFNQLYERRQQAQAPTVN